MSDEVWKDIDGWLFVYLLTESLDILEHSQIYKRLQTEQKH